MRKTKKTTLSNQMWEEAETLAELSGLSETVILNMIQYDVSHFDEKCKKGSKTHIEFRNMIHNFSLKYWELVAVENINNRSFNSSTYNFIMKNRFPELYGENKNKSIVVDDRPIQIMLNTTLATPIHTEKELLEREKIVLNDLFEDSNTKEMDFEDE